jgi:serine/threonine protein kinase
LNADLGIPGVEGSTVEQVMRKFDTDDDRKLNFEEFVRFYERLLYKVRDHYGGFRVRREFFLEKRHGKPSERYRVKKQLGQGSYGIVTLVEDLLTKRQLVMKTVNKEKSRLPPEVLEQEFKNLKLLDHPHIIKIYDYYEDYQHIYIIMELAEGGELLDVIEKTYRQGKTIEERWAMTVFRQVLEATAYCHSRGVVNKDIKSENIMLIRRDPVHAVVLDFGLAEAFSHSQGRSDIVSGTPYTMAPEVWMLAQGKVKSVGYKCDLYSIGCVLFHVLSGNFPVIAKGVDPFVWVQAIKRGPNFDLLNHCSREAVDLCRRLLAFREEDRPTARLALGHPWFKLTPEIHLNKLTPEMMKNLAAYARRSAFEKAVLLQVATLAKSADVPQINAIFRSLDREAEGALDRPRCAEALVRLGLKKDVANEVAKGLDADGNNRIEYTEFVAGVLCVFEDHVNNLLWGVFSSIDRDGDGVLDVHEVRHILRKGELNNLGLVPSSAEIERTIAELDRNKDGRVSFEEFKQFFHQKLNLSHAAKQ